METNEMFGRHRFGYNRIRGNINVGVAHVAVGSQNTRTAVTLLTKYRVYIDRFPLTFCFMPIEEAEPHRTEPSTKSNGG